MTLSERLAAAAKARQQERGVGSRAQLVADAPDGTAVVDAQPARPRQAWGTPGDCPSCGQPGFLDRIDLVSRVMYQHCPDCGNLWELAEADL